MVGTYREVQEGLDDAKHERAEHDAATSAHRSLHQSLQMDLSDSEAVDFALMLSREGLDTDSRILSGGLRDSTSVHRPSIDSRALEDEDLQLALALSLSMS